MASQAPEPRNPQSRSLYQTTFDHLAYDKATCVTALLDGMNVRKYIRFGAPHYREFSISEVDRSVLVWASERKPPARSRLRLNAIWKIDQGQNTKRMRKHYDRAFDDKTVALYYKNHKSLDLLFDSRDQFETFLAAIQHLIDEINESMSNERLRETRIRNAAWALADANQDNQLSLDEVCALLRQKGCGMNKREVKRYFAAFDRDESAQINAEEFEDFLDGLDTKEALHSVFGSEKLMSVRTFREFLHHEQHLDLSDEELNELVGQITEPNERGINFKAFCRYACSLTLNNAFDPRQSECSMPMDQPLAHYFIESSHNTYLVGHQLAGESSTEMYAKVLLSGCRCVELDIWDGPDDQPKVTHGRTLVSNVSLAVVAQAIKSAAFENSPFPLILSLENHCSPPQQDRIANILVEVFGEALYMPENPKALLPSPAALQHRVLIKAKPCKSEQLNAISALPGVKEFLGRDTYVTIPSRSDAAMLKLLKQLGSSIIVDMHKMFLTRVYPSAKHFASSNYDPVLYWFLGAQVVAVNYQTGDVGAILNTGFFQQNGRTGYVLKPEFLRSEGSLFFLSNPSTENKRKVHVRVLSAHHLPMEKHPGSNLYVKVQIHGIPTDCAEKKTAKEHHKQLSVVWDQQFLFDVTVPEVTMLSMTIVVRKALSKKTVALAAIPVACIREGYRVIQLYDSNAHALPDSYILCKFKIEC